MVVHREPEWDATARAKALAAVEHEKQTCAQCGSSDSVVPVLKEDRYVSHTGRRFHIEAYRCLACAVLEAARRDFRKRHEKSDSAEDGLRMTVTETPKPA